MLTVVQLRFEIHASTDEHAVGWDIDVMCLEGEGNTVIDGQAEALRSDQWVHWPAGKPHRLFTENTTMITLMLEHVGPGNDRPPR